MERAAREPRDSTGSCGPIKAINGLFACENSRTIGGQSSKWGRDYGVVVAISCQLPRCHALFTIFPSAAAMIIYHSPYPSITHLIPDVTLPAFLLGPTGVPSGGPSSTLVHAEAGEFDAPLYNPPPAVNLADRSDLPDELKQIPPPIRPLAKPLSLNGIKERAEQFALGLREKGWEKGHVLSVVSENQHDYAAAILGAHLLGVMTALHNPSYTARELTGQFELVETRGVLASRKASGNCKEALQDGCHDGTGSDARMIWTFDEPRDDGSGETESTPSWFSLFPSQPSSSTLAQLWESHTANVAADDDAVYCFSSGTSGKPKTVRLSHGNLVANVIQATSEMRDRTHRPLLDRWSEGNDGDEGEEDKPVSWYNEPADEAPIVRVGPECERRAGGDDDNEKQSKFGKSTPASLLSTISRKLKITSKSARDRAHSSPTSLSGHSTQAEKHIDILPQFHCYGLVVAFVALHTNTPRFVLPRFSLPLFLHLVTQHKITFAFVVPPILLALARSPLATHDSVDLSSLTRLASGAASLPAKLRQEMWSKHHIKVTNGYGMSEMSPIISLQMIRDLEASPDSVGLLSTSTEARIVDVVTGKDVDGYDTLGELWLRGPQRMRGYLNNPQANESTFVNSDGDGQDWLRTGDVVSIDSRGYITIHDRTKDVIKVHGFQVSPSELEEALIACAEIHDVAVIGVKLDEGEDAEDVPWAFCVAAQGEKSSQETSSLLKDVNQHLARYKHVRGGKSQSPAGQQRAIRRPH